MDKTSAFVKIKERSLFSFFGNEDCDRLLKSASLLHFDPGSTVDKGTNPQDLHIVVNGEIGLYNEGQKTGIVGKVIEGRALELKTILRGDEHWSYNWVAEKPSTLFRLPIQNFQEALAQSPKVKDYLTKVTVFSELQKLKNDMRLYGFTMEDVHATFNGLTLMPFDGIAEKLQSAFNLAIINAGALSLKANINDQIKTVGHFTAGDYFVLDLNRQELEVEAEPDTKLWILNQEWWTQTIGEEKSKSFLSLIDPVGAKLKTFQEYGQEEAPPPPPMSEETDDGLSVNDFTVDEKELQKAWARKPVHIKQHDEMDCGAACMSMISHYYGRRIKIPAWRSIIHVTREGASMLSIKKGSERVGYKTIGIYSGFKGLLKLRVPFIALMQYHFIVVYKVTDKDVVVGDPAHAQITTLSVEQFKAEWSQNALMLEYTPKVNEWPETANSYKKYLLIFKGHEKNIAEAFLLSIVIFFLNMIVPFFTQYFTDSIYGTKEKSMLTILGIAMLVTNVLTTVTDWFRDYMFAHLTSTVDTKFTALFLRHVYKLPLGFFEVRRVGDITGRIEEIEKIRSFVTGSTLEMLVNLISVVIYTSVVALFSWKILVLIALIIPLQLLYVVWRTPKLIDANQEAFKIGVKSQSMTYEQFNCIETLKSVGGLLSARWRWEKQTVETIKLSRKMEIMGAKMESMSGVLDHGTDVAVLMLSIHLYMKGELSVGQVFAIGGLTNSVVGPIMALVNQWDEINHVKVSMDRLDDIITSAVENDPPSSSYPKGTKFKGQIEFKNISFQYGSELSPMVLDDVSFTINAGETVAMVGGSGSGKSTLGKMVNLLYTPTKGKVMIDGVDASQIPLAVLRSEVAMIIQENSMFSGSVLENITMGDTYPDFKKAMEAARRADAHNFVAGLKEGYSTHLGESGDGLSGGQKQRINIARAFYRDPSILIMDEATSALDAVSEQTIVNNIKNQAVKRTTIIIAHRLNTIMHADRIIAMKHGRIQEMGTHKELIAKQGYYFDLFRKQLNL